MNRLIFILLLLPSLCFGQTIPIYNGKVLTYGGVPLPYSYDNTYYVSTSGNDSHSGTSQSAPWLTLAHAETNAPAGSTIALKRGDTWTENNIFEITHGGTAGNPTIWDGSLWGTGANAVIQSNTDGGATPLWRNVVRFVACSYVTFQNIKVDGNSKKRHGMVIGGADDYDGPTTQNNENNIIIQDCELVNVGDGTDYQQGILIRARETNISNCTIRRNTISNIASHGISIYNSWILYGADPNVSVNDCYIGYNIIDLCGRYTAGAKSVISVGRKCSDIVIEHNNVTAEVDWYDPAITINPTLENYNSVDYELIPQNLIIRYNNITCAENHMGISVLPARTGAGSAQVACGLNYQIYGNTIYSESTALDGIKINEDAADFSGSDIKVYFNTIVTEGGNPFRDIIGSGSGNVTFKNNIFFNNWNTDNFHWVCITSQGNTHSNNLYYMSVCGDWVNEVGGAGGRTSAEITSSWETTAVVTDPTFTVEFTNLHYQTGSSVDGAGVTVAGITEDIEGTAMTEPPDIGAYHSIEDP